jgi:hypothetical protein
LILRKAPRGVAFRITDEINGWVLEFISLYPIFYRP